MHTSLTKYFQALHAYAINARYVDTNVGRLKLFRINYVFGYIAWLVDCWSFECRRQFYIVNGMEKYYIGVN